MRHPLSSVGFATNPKKPKARGLRRQISRFLRSNGVHIRPPARAQVLITIGGDGTILYNKNRYRRPVWAIGSDTSFICQSNRKRWKKELEPLVRRGFSVERRLMLSATLNNKALPDALNEVVVRSQHHRVLRIKLRVGRKTFRFSADGLIFAAPTGSTGYAYSAGGKEMRTTDNRYQVVPIAPYRRAFKPVIVPASTVCRIELMNRCRADAVVDGQMHRPIRKGSILVVRKAKRALEYVKK